MAAASLLVLLSWIACAQAQHASTADELHGHGVSASLSAELFLRFVRERAGNCEMHNVTTEDGYVLTMFRIPGAGKPVIVQHGILDSSWDMVIGGESKSAVALAIASWGYDVWLPNARGNTFSRKHVRYEVSSQEFWNTSVADLSMFDTPANIAYVLNVTGAKSVTYVGHSQGSETMFLGLAEWTWTGAPSPRRAQQQKARTFLESSIDLFVGLSPVSYLKDTRSALLWAVSHAHFGDLIYKYDSKAFLPHTWPSALLEQQLCFWITKFSPIKVCEIGLSLICGVSDQDDKQRVTAASGVVPAGTPMRNIVQFQQFIDSGRVGDFDFGAAGNLAAYGQSDVPNATFSTIKVPMALLFAGNDDLAAPGDRARLLSELDARHVSHKIYEDFSHATWFVGTDEAFSAFLPDLKYALENKVLPSSELEPPSMLV
eukprot:gb/GFBE01063371.1/.p1 GENE.gb/GFBE01063371.1/~~gb/GFBE01063371.1/.p1  ORF type:complete len:430 (+),score=95.49 gb/GFBE01063371.1/:1-1290(+)